MMNRNDYELLAKVLKETKPVIDSSTLKLTYQTAQWEKDVKALAQHLSNQNARFNFSIFYEACGLDLVKKDQ